MGLKDAIAQQVLKIIDNTLGNKFNDVDKVTDLFQGQENRMDDFEERIKQLENKRSM